MIAHVYHSVFVGLIDTAHSPLDLLARIAIALWIYTLPIQVFACRKVLTKEIAAYSLCLGWSGVW